MKSFIKQLAIILKFLEPALARKTLRTKESLHNITRDDEYKQSNSDLKVNLNPVSEPETKKRVLEYICIGSIAGIGILIIVLMSNKAKPIVERQGIYSKTGIPAGFEHIFDGFSKFYESEILDNSLVQKFKNDLDSKKIITMVTSPGKNGQLTITEMNGNNIVFTMTIKKETLRFYSSFTRALQTFFENMSIDSE